MPPEPKRPRRPPAFGLGTVSFLAGIFGFTRIRRETPGATVFGPPIEQIHETGRQAGTTA